MSISIKEDNIKYFVEYSMYSGYFVNFGLYNYTNDVGDVVLSLLRLNEYRTIDGVSVLDMKFPTEWQRLPKKWTYNTELFKLDWNRNFSTKLKVYNIKNRHDLKVAIEEEYLTTLTDPLYRFESEVDRNTASWRIVKRYNSTAPLTVTRKSNEIFDSYEEAEKHRNNIIKELERKCALSDEEWSIEEMEKTFNRYNKFYPNKSEYLSKARDIILKLEHIEDVAVRIFDGYIEYMYDKNGYRKNGWYRIEYDQ